MRVSAQKDGISASAVAGTYVVLIGFDVSEDVRKDLLGFAIEREDKKENERYWLKGFRTFQETAPNPPPGSLVSTHDHPVQDFVWSDFTAKPDHQYIYRVVAVSGKPKNLQYSEPVELAVNTESEQSSGHSVYFNRGVIGSQAYAREFNNVPPDKLKGDQQKKAFQWLSRGLEEAMLAFIGQANSSRFGLRAAVYEFDYEPAIAAFGAAQKKCKNVQIVYDGRTPNADAKKRVAKVKQSLKKYGLSSVATPRTKNPNFIAHNKFVVLLDNKRPVAVWTGSTNFTESGIFGQSNVGHVVHDPVVAQHYLDCWTRLQKDPEAADIRKANNAASPNLDGYPPPEGTSTIFSPRSDLNMLNWYADDAMKGTEHLLCFTAAFGVNQVFLDVLNVPADKLRYIFLEKWGVNKKLADGAQKALGGDKFNQVAIGGYLSSDVIGKYLENRWKVESSNSLSKNVRFVHTKYMIVDPLGEDPLVISGSANFSDASTKNNDENMLIIRGDKRVADIYLGEFMRLWQHHRFRYIQALMGQKDAQANYNPEYLDPTTKWSADYFKPNTVKCKKRLAFAGPSPASGVKVRKAHG